MTDNRKPHAAPDAQTGIDETEFFKSIFDLLEQTLHTLERNVNTAMVITYYEIGRRIVEKEQVVTDRKQHDKHILQGLSDYLATQFGKRYSVDNLRLMRKFYMVYSETATSESPIPQFNPNISWTHYVQLMRIADTRKRNFYELKIAGNNWSVKEFLRQLDSFLYERLALSRDR